MPTLPPGRLTFGQIRKFALAKAGNRAVIADANVWLTQLLYELYVSWTWPFLMTRASIAINGPTFPLPTDFLQSEDDNGLQIRTFSGQLVQPPIAFMTEVDPTTFVSVMTEGTATGGMPRIWYPDRGDGLARVFPDPAGQVALCTLRYKFLPVAETTPPPDNTPAANDALVPIFPYHLFLVQALYVLALEYEQDPRAPQERANATQQLAAIRGTAMPLRSQSPVIPLDPQVFDTPFTEDLSGEREQ